MRILMVEDEAGDAELAQHVLRQGGFQFAFKCVDSKRAFEEQLKDFRPNVILSDHGLCAFDGFSALAVAKERCPDVPFIFVTGSLGEEMATHALKSGATDFILKHHMAGLAPAVHRALREAHSRLQRKKAEQEILRLNEELERRVAQRTAELEAANKELEAFSYSVSHELRAPLRHVGGYIDLLSETKGPGMDAEAQRYIKTIASATKRLGRLIDDLLSFSRTARIGARKTKVSLKAICNNAIRELAGDLVGRKVEWIWGEMPAANGDPSLLCQVFVNLIGNALKYTRRQPLARIEVGSSKTDQEIVVFVKDNGVGFDMRHADRLFAVFQRLHPPSEFEGVGIGLAHVRRIIHQHGGRTWAEGEVNQGATFYFSLPL